MWWTIDDLYSLRIRLKNILGVIHFHIRKNVVSPVQNLMITHLEATSLPSFDKIRNLLDGEKTAIVWVCHNGRRRISLLFNFTEKDVEFKHFQFKNEPMKSFELSSVLTLSFDEYQKLLDIIPKVGRAVDVAESIVIFQDETARTS